MPFVSAFWHLDEALDEALDDGLSLLAWGYGRESGWVSDACQVALCGRWHPTLRFPVDHFIPSAKEAEA